MSNNLKDIFISQQDQALYPESGCGVASILMLLKFINFKPLPTWSELCDELRLNVSPIQKGYSKHDPEIGLYPEDIFKYIIKKDLSFRMHFFDNEWQQCLQAAPIMVLLHGVLNEFPDESHWIVLTSYDGKNFAYLDPWCKKEDEITKSINLSNFKKYYTGIACQLFNKGEIFNEN